MNAESPNGLVIPDAIPANFSIICGMLMVYTLSCPHANLISAKNAVCMIKYVTADGVEPSQLSQSFSLSIRRVSLAAQQLFPAAHFTGANYLVSTFWPSQFATAPATEKAIGQLNLARIKERNGFQSLLDGNFSKTQDDFQQSETRITVFIRFMKSLHSSELGGTTSITQMRRGKFCRPSLKRLSRGPLLTSSISVSRLGHLGGAYPYDF